ncbi:hypothetical protein Tco_0675884 [Tanacetum coccineum]
MSTYEAAASLSEFKITKILIDKMEKNKSYDKADYKKKLYDALAVERRICDKIEDPHRYAKDLNKGKIRKEGNRSDMRGAKVLHVDRLGLYNQDQEFVTRDNDEQPADKEVTKANWFKKPERPPTLI